jgi:Lipid A 3-O-deacylase (PagL)
LILVATTMLAMASPVRAQQGPEKGGHEVQLWTGGGRSTGGGVHGIGVWNAGFRYGWILTEGHGPSILHGRFEYALDTTPIFWFFQPGGTALGAGLSPVVLKWNFDAGDRVVPYVEANAGFVFTSRDVPPGAWRGNFTSSGAIGAHFLRERGNLSAEIRFMHISNANLTTYNPGINTIQVRIGLGRFFGSN